ncbi:MAG: hypothetical protein ACO1PW_03500 [Actinomycetota bacterium]
MTLDGPRNPVTFLLSPDWTPPTGSPAVYVAVFSAALVAAFVVASLRPAAPPAGA